MWDIRHKFLSCIFQILQHTKHWIKFIRNILCFRISGYLHRLIKITGRNHRNRAGYFLHRHYNLTGIQNRNHKNNKSKHQYERNSNRLHRIIQSVHTVQRKIHYDNTINRIALRIMHRKDQFYHVFTLAYKFAVCTVDTPDNFLQKNYFTFF